MLFLCSAGFEVSNEIVSFTGLLDIRDHAVVVAPPYLKNVIIYLLYRECFNEYLGNLITTLSSEHFLIFRGLYYFVGEVIRFTFKSFASTKRS